MRLEGDERDVKAEFVKGGATRGGREMSFVDVEGYVEGASVWDGVNEASFFGVNTVFVGGKVGCNRDAFKNGV